LYKYAIKVHDLFMSEKNKILVILGPTATGKSCLAVKLARKYNGEVISADSRQVYKGLNIGTGKITIKEMLGVPHHLLDVASLNPPAGGFTVAEWQKLAQKKISEIVGKGKLSIICGGTGFYIKSIVDGIVLPEVLPNKSLRKKLENKNLSNLVQILKRFDPERLKTIDTKNRVRLIRAIEIATKLGSVPSLRRAQDKNSFEFLQIGLTLPDKKLREKISIRLFERIRKGMIEEAKRLHRNGLSWKRMRELGLEYRYLALYLQNKISKEKLIEKLQTEIWRYAKRQMTWFKRDKKINWFSPTESKKILKKVENFFDR